MSPLFERLRDALTPDYAVDRELGGGGMGIVFLGREEALERDVAIKILRPDLATAVAAERFLREARLLASVTHPNVVSIFRAEQKAGFYFFVMERLADSLEERLRDGPLAVDEGMRCGLALLDGIAAVHDRGIVHRDIKPGNIFFRGGEPVLGDFGIAKRTGRSEGTLTQPGHYPGTPAYMSPEQLAGGEVTVASDIYAAGMVLYETFTGRRWEGIGDPERGDWTGVPRRVARVLQRALALEPSRRWPNAQAFRGALGRAAGAGFPRVGGPVAALTGVAALVVAMVVWGNGAPRGERELADVALLPFGGAEADREWRDLVAKVAELHLEKAFVRDTLRVTPLELAARWWQEQGAPDSVPAETWRVLRTRHVVSGHLVRARDSVTIRLAVGGRDGRMRPAAEVSGPASDQHGLGYRVAAEIVAAVEPRKVGEFVGYREFAGRSGDAWEAFIAGERAFARENWSAAEQFYLTALRRDSTLARAWWGLYNVRRWRRVPDGVDLASVYARYAGDFPTLDVLLIRADLSQGEPRLRGLEQAIAAFPYHAEPRLLLGNELFHRGALAGIGLDSAVRVLEGAGERNEFLAPVFSTLAWAEIRRGNGPAARRALERYAAIAHPITEAEFCLQCMLTLTWAERFAPGEAARARAEILNTPGQLPSLARTVRWGLSYGIPTAQVEVSELLAAAAPDREGRADALVGQGLGLVALGRVGAALERFDSAAALAPGGELPLQAAQWRVLLPALGVPGVDPRERDRGRAVLQGHIGPPLADRARWTLAVDALARNETAAAEALRDSLADPASAPLRQVVDALRLASRDSVAEALALLDGLRTLAFNARLGDPFARAVIYLERGRLLARLGRAAADSAWLWYENADLRGWPAGPAHAAEIDWALETWGRSLRGARAAARGDATLVCDVLPDVVKRWSGADPAFAASLRAASEAARPCGRGAGSSR